MEIKRGGVEPQEKEGEVCLPSLSAGPWALGDSVSWFRDCFYSSSSLDFYTATTLSSYVVWYTG